MKFVNPEIEIVRFSSEDVIATSGAPISTKLFYIPTTDYMGDLSGSDYVQFEGVMGGYDSAAGGYRITDVYSPALADTDEVNGLMSGGTLYIPELGITIPSTVMAPIAQQAYNAYSYNGEYYTNGLTYYDMYWSN